MLFIKYVILCSFVIFFFLFLFLFLFRCLCVYLFLFSFDFTDDQKSQDSKHLILYDAVSSEQIVESSDETVSVPASQLVSKQVTREVASEEQAPHVEHQKKVLRVISQSIREE